jgi:hypothetical protein
MSDEVYERLRQRVSGNGRSAPRPEDVEQLKQAAGGIQLPAIAVNPRAWTPSIAVPEVKALSNDRRDRREALEARREMAQLARTSIKIGVAIQAVQGVNTYAVYAVDQTQEDMMEILHSRTRYEGMNELVASVISQCLQQTIAQTLALAEHHFKRQMEAL